MANTVALIDDDRALLDTMRDVLQADGLAVLAYDDGAQALEALRQNPADVVVLDIRMPGIDGYELLARLRKDSSVPVIFLTTQDDELDEVLGLRMGADDYITKPVSHRLLLARIHALLRRGELAHGRSESARIVERGELRLDPSRHECSWGSRPLKLTVTEFLLLTSLVQRPGQIKSRKQLVEAAYGEDGHGDERTIDSHVKRLRAKFKAIDPDFNLIETLYGVGYRFRAAPRAGAGSAPTGSRP